MKIDIKAKLKPFSHTPGASCLVPGTHWFIEAFPTRLLFRHAFKTLETQLPFTGPLVGFTLEQDLEKHCVFVFGKAREGFFRLRIEGSDSGFHIVFERGPSKKDPIHFSVETSFVPKAPFERLSLGSHKAQDWDQMRRRSNMKEWLPILFCLGQKIPHVPPQKIAGTARLLALPSDRKDAAAALDVFFAAAFTSMLVPRLVDDQFQGLCPDESAAGEPCFLIQEGAKAIRSLFFRQNDRRIELLPFLPIPLDCGRMIGMKADGIGEIDLEWSKKQLSRIIIRANTSGDIVLALPKEIQDFRVRTSLKEKGVRHPGGEPLLLAAGEVYFLDRFQK